MDPKPSSSPCRPTTWGGGVLSSINEVLALPASLRRVAERDVAAGEKVLSYFRERDSLGAVSREELLRRMRQGVVSVIATSAYP